MPDQEDEELANLQDIVASQYFGYGSYEGASRSGKQDIRIWMSDFFGVVGNIKTVRDNMANDTLPLHQKAILDDLINHPEILDLFVQNYVDIKDTTDTNADNEDAERAGYSVFQLIQDYRAYVARTGDDSIFIPEKDLIDEQIKQFGDFQLYLNSVDTFKQISERMTGPGKFREDHPPASIQRWQCRIGASTFFIPPTNISVHQAFQAGSMTNGVLRQPNSPKMNLGYSQTEINITLYFPNHETIWGFEGDKADFNIFNWDPNPQYRKDRADVSGQTQNPNGKLVSDEVIDRYLSSLRGLITQFKYAPFLPVKNEYLNRTYGIDAVTMAGMTVQTMPDFPFVLVVNLQMNKFNYVPFMPMIDHFDQAIHWGKYRQYMGRAAARLDSKVNQGFLVEQEATPIIVVDSESNDDDLIDHIIDGSTTAGGTLVKFEGDLLPRLDKARDIKDGRNFDFYYPITTPARIFAPDTTDFRQPGEDEIVTQDTWDFLLSDLGLDVVTPIQFQTNFFEYDRQYRTSKYRNERKVLREWLKANNVAWQLMTSDKMADYAEQVIINGKKDGTINSSNETSVRNNLTNNWFLMLYELVLNDTPGFADMIKARNEQSGKYLLKEWNVPMDRLYIDWANCIVNSVSVSLSNNFATLQVQLQDEPTYQHIGGGDSRVNVNMIVIGEENLIRYRRLFEHINGLARIEKVHGVLGFLGIKNIITALCGIKYVLPNDFEVETVPNYPHVYSVNMSFIDFDIMQQERESLSSSQQKQLVEIFGKRNPFLRLKQSWGLFNAYPDLPLDVRDDNGDIIGHLDPDWYFRSFSTTNSDSDIFSWGFNDGIVGLVQNIDSLRQTIKQLEERRDPVFNAESSPGAGDVASIDAVDRFFELLHKKLKDLEDQLIRTAADSDAVLPTGWKIDEDGVLSYVDAADQVIEMPEPEFTHILGVFDEEQTKAAFIEMHAGGFFVLGSMDINSKEKTYYTGLSTVKEDYAANNIPGQKAIESTRALSEYQQAYIDNSSNPNRQFEAIMQDFNYRNLRGRMVKAFPTYMLWLIDEGGRFAGIKLFDNFYGLNSVIDFSVVASEDAIGDTLVLRLSNIYQKLTTPYKDALISEDSPLYDTPIGRWISTIENRQRNIVSGMTNEIFELNSIRLKPGVRIHLRAGYSANPAALQTIFNGVIAEVQPGDIVTVVAQSDAVEFTGFVNTTNSKGSSGTLDGGINTGFWLSEPRDLIVRLLSMGTSRFKEWLSWGSKGILFSESRFGIRHFGSITYDPMTPDEAKNARDLQQAGADTMNTANPNDGTDQFRGILSNFSKDLSELSNLAQIPSTVLNGGIMQIMQILLARDFAKRDYEIFKRNVYPGNGSGIAQFMGGDRIDAGLTIQTAVSYYQKNSDRDPFTPISVSDQIAQQGNITIMEDILNPFGSGGTSAKRTANVTDTTDIWEQYGSTALEDDEIISVIKDANYNDTELSTYHTESFWEDLGNDVWDNILFPAAAGLFVGASIMSGGTLAVLGAAVGLGYASTKVEIPVVTSVTRGVTRLFAGAHDLASAIGLYSSENDDDLAGYDEVSFRAQTYMKTVWDLFQTCAALLPNYIVAVRPFEDRSTLFYGKPHWLYTSGVVPVTLGVPKDRSVAPFIEEHDSIEATALREVAKQSGNEYERLMTLVEKSNSIKNITDIVLGENLDPYNAGIGDVSIITSEQLQGILDELIEDQNPTSIFLDTISSLDFSGMTPEQLRTSLLGESMGEDFFEIYASNSPDEIRELFEVRLDNIRTYNRTQISNSAENIRDQAEKLPDSVGFNDLAKDDVEKQKLIDFYARDPITFGYQFGWKIADIPISYGIEYGIDKIGSTALSYITSASGGSMALSSSRSETEANDIWYEFRTKFPDSSEAHDVFIMRHPEIEFETEEYHGTVDLFLRYMWQDPYNRAWIVNAADKNAYVHSPTDWVTDPLGITDTSDSWSWGNIKPVWDKFLTSTDIEVDETTRLVTSNSISNYLKSNVVNGNDSNWYVHNPVDVVTDIWDNGIGSLLGIITDTLSGFIASIRNSLAQMSNAISQAGLMQRNANVFNALLNDSIYYSADHGPLFQMVDNPFTREYGEPVIEIREPFQRVHFVSSFTEILDNKIAENLDNVATVVTAVSDGKYPVTVHFDKGISPERQVEKVVETGIYWDNAVGSGLFGFLQPLIHPLETLRGYNKALSGSSDQLTARRIALYHLKESLKNIYTGEITILGDADIRPHDLLYIADASERMYGMVEVEQVVHHFTPETGFVTAITPNALVSVNDPARWTLLSYMWSKFSNFNMRDDVRAYMGVKAERNLAAVGKTLDSGDIYKNFGTQINGSVQYTQGNSAFIRDLGAMFTTSSVSSLTAADRTANKIANIDIQLGLAKAGLAGAGALAGSLGSPAGAVLGAGIGWVAGDLMWEAWQWVKDNLLDQHGCYIQYMNKDGQPMDAGLSYAQGVSAGTNHSISLFPNNMGLQSRVPVKEDGHYRITTNDILGSLGWTEIETLSIYRDTSMFVNQINADILQITGRDPTTIPNDDYVVFIARVLDPSGEEVRQYDREFYGIEDGDTLHVRVLDVTSGGILTPGEIITIRLSVIDTYELQVHDNPYSPENEALNDNAENDLGRLAYEYLRSRFSRAEDRLVAVRVSRKDQKDAYGRTLGTIFHNAPLGSDIVQRENALRDFASRIPPIPFDAYLPDGRPYTLNWEMVMTGFGHVDMRESLWNSTWRKDAITNL